MPQRILLVDQMTIPTTSSGKIQRGACRQMYLDCELAALFDWTAPTPDAVDQRAVTQRAAMIQQAVAQRQ